MNGQLREAGTSIGNGLQAIAKAIHYASDAYVTSQREGRELAARILDEAKEGKLDG